MAYRFGSGNGNGRDDNHAVPNLDVKKVLSIRPRPEFSSAFWLAEPLMFLNQGKISQTVLTDHVINSFLGRSERRRARIEVLNVLDCVRVEIF